MKVIECFKDFDIFSESVQFNSSRRRLRKRTVAGALLTISIIVLTIIYFIYQSYLYFTGQMDPKFRQQTFVSNDVSLQIHNEMFGFDFFSLQSGQYLSQKQEQENKTYMVYVATFISTNHTGSSEVPLDVIKCQNEELKGLNCFDFSKLPHQELILKDRQTVFSYINLYTYRCQDIDRLKPFAPNNCAEEKLIDVFLTTGPYRFMVKMQVSQYNITSQQIESQYKFINLVTQINTVFSSQIKLQKQVSKISQGLIVQSEQTFSSPISSQVTSQSINRNLLIQAQGIKIISQIYITLDESVTYFNIQFPIFTEVLALCNSTMALLLLLGSFCRKLAQKFIRRDIFFILMKEFFSGTYFSILEHNNIITTNLNNQTEQKQQNQDDQMGNDEESKKNIFMPHLDVKSSIRVLQQQYTKQTENTEQDYVKEEIVTQLRQSEELGKSLRINDSKFNKVLNTLEKQQELQTISGLNKPGQNENDIEQVPSIFSSKSPKQQFQFITKDLSGSRSPVFQKRLNRIKRPDQSIQIDTENDQKNIQNPSQKIDQNFQNLNDKSIQFKLEQILFKPTFFKKKDYLHSKGMKQQSINEIESRIDDGLDFFIFYKDILLIKKAIMIMLNKEQLAALQFVGMDLDTLKLNQENTIMTSQQGIFVLLINPNKKQNLKQLEETYVNHFKEQYEILQSKELQQQYINEFFKRCQQNMNIDIIDKRILSSIQINSQN